MWLCCCTPCHTTRGDCRLRKRRNFSRDTFILSLSSNSPASNWMERVKKRRARVQLDYIAPLLPLICRRMRLSIRPSSGGENPVARHWKVMQGPYILVETQTENRIRRWWWCISERRLHLSSRTVVDSDDSRLSLLILPSLVKVFPLSLFFLYFFYENVWARASSRKTYNYNGKYVFSRNKQTANNNRQWILKSAVTSLLGPKVKQQTVWVVISFKRERYICAFAGLISLPRVNNNYPFSRSLFFFLVEYSAGALWWWRGKLSLRIVLFSRSAEATHIWN